MLTDIQENGIILILIIHICALFSGHRYIELFLRSNPESGNSQGWGGSGGGHNFSGGHGGGGSNYSYLVCIHNFTLLIFTSMDSVLSVLYTPLILLIRRICAIIKSFFN